MPKGENSPAFSEAALLAKAPAAQRALIAMAMKQASGGYQPDPYGLGMYRPGYPISGEEMARGAGGMGGMLAAAMAGAAKRGSLDMSEAAVAKRAKDMGFDTTPVYHGTPSGGFSEFKHKQTRDEGYIGSGHYFTENKAVADTFQGDRMNSPVGKKGKPETYEAFLRTEKPLRLNASPEEWRRLIDVQRAARGLKPIEDDRWSGYAESIQAAHKRWGDNEVGLSYELKTLLGDLGRLAEGGGYDSMIAPGIEGGTRVVFNPTQIRSTKAKFDPKKKNSADLLAGIAGAGLLGLTAEQYYGYERKH